MSKEQILAKLRADVQQFGWHCLSVHPRVGQGGAHFTYTIGLTETFNHPEIMIFGLESKASHEILTGCVEMLRAGTVFEPDIEYANVFGNGYKAVFKRVKDSCLPDYFGAAVRYYDGKPFSGFVLFWPNKQHLFPWQEAESEQQRDAMNVV